MCIRDRYIAERCIKLIHALSKLAKLNWERDSKALETIYKGAILPLMLYRAPVLINTLKYKANSIKYTRFKG